MMGPQSLLTAALILLAASTVPRNEAKTVIMMPFPWASYIVYHANIAKALTKLGHEVWICLPHCLLEKNLIKDKSIHTIVYGESMGDIVAKLQESTQMVENFWSGKDEGLRAMLTMLKLGPDINEMSVAILSEEPFVEKVKSLNADLFVLESNVFFLGMLVLPYKLDIPYALIGTFHDVAMSRVPHTPAATPIPVLAMSDKISFSQRLLVAFFSFIRFPFEPFYDSSLVTRFAPERPYVSLTDLAARAEIFISELDHILDYPRPTLPNTKITGGSSASPAKPLSGEFKNFVEGSKHEGVIVVSFGSSVVDLPPFITSKMASAFQQLDVSVVWRVNVSSPEPSRIMTSRWIPQNDLLGHEKTKLFVSHCGKNGQYEALYHGVPILCLPIYGDQPYNAERVRVKELGLTADMRSASADDLAGLMKQLLYEDKYSQNMKRASSLFRELYKLPMKEVAYWLDHVMTYGGDYMRSSAQEMPLYQFLMLDVIGFVLAVVVFTLVLTCGLTRWCCRRCLGRRTGSKSKVD
jgi:glucuronosyltransferase